MRKDWSHLDIYREIEGPFATPKGVRYGKFVVPDHGLLIIAHDGRGNNPLSGWEHVSVSLYNAPKVCPTWDLMCWVKNLFWDEHEAVFQLHPAKADYVNRHPGCLHLWRPVDGKFPTPPKILVG
jgi:hypothetical protein